jgi:defect-in-organelle-trafficking protein DotC
LLGGCAGLFHQDIDTMNLASLQNITPAAAMHESAATQVNHMRIEALRETAMSLGAQAGLAWRAEQINVTLEKDQRYLRTVFNFHAMIMNHGVLPPVLAEGKNTLNLANTTTIRIADQSYKILEQARFVTAAPTWRNYLWLAYKRPGIPDKSLLPRDRAESRVWGKQIKIGWQKGVEQADSIFKQNLARLTAEYRGMVLYRRLLAEKMVSPPFVAKTNLGVTGDGSSMRINDQVLRITALPHLQTNSRKWHPLLVKRGE